ncbi:NAD(P)H-hydrate epimerase [Gulosibacter chungangensis]|uniref:NAD(P)H-hydrate epimerase n=1 Tax=Gulosibacter chungangensis TaxID=979746 RepID=A0A7J5BHI1_9MICO|nr:NAD(P)H-hydrate epimerase [Gulosibacter chungangensis]KAB1644869.1 NAD(P)H-hydrate epimerase [Gulosibacter chungangensis]
MRNGYSAAQIREAEAPFLERGVPLMIRAAQSLAEHVTSILPAPSESRVLVLAGPGDNGGDAAYAASFIANAGVKVQVVAVSGRLHEAAEAAARDEGAEILLDAPPESAAALVAGADVVLDGVLGIGNGGAAAGGTPALRDPARAFVVAVKEAIASAPDPAPIVIAVDMPSGIDPDDGSVPDPDAVIKAQLTVTFIGVKAGLLLEPAASLSGKVWLEPLGASQGLLRVRPEVSLP